ncbi:helix-turn-helix domain-containing protein [Acidihalobacter prosperus]|uniref:helix-turn-helix domain-containing protein n=1 Tax=Acidihalobacter prosperus TaxID=160660 RepID=UPI000507A484|nr:AraC family transcriptional regulator [Acidihalobacter prosperus]
MSPKQPQSTLAIRAYDAAPGAHAHAHTQVLWALQGTLELEIEGQGMCLREGEALLLRPGEHHDFHSRAGCRCLVLDSHDHHWAGRAQRPRNAATAHKLAQYLALAMIGDHAVSAQLGVMLLARDWGATGTRMRSRRDVDWAEMTDWVLRNLSRPLTTADLAAHVWLSESRFRSRCVEALGCSPMAWVRALRLEHARLLRAGGTPWQQVARRTGYASAAALMAALKRPGQS